MAQMAIVINRHPAAVHRHPTRMDGGKGLFAFGEGVVEGEGHGWMGGRLDEWMSGWVLGFGPCTVNRVPCTQNLVFFGDTVLQLFFHRLEI